MLKSTTEVQDALLLSRRRAKKKIGGRRKNGVAKKNFRGFHCFPIENIPKSARGARRRKNYHLFPEKKTRAQRAKKKIGECINYSGTLISTLRVSVEKHFRTCGTCFSMSAKSASLFGSITPCCCWVLGAAACTQLPREDRAARQALHTRDPDADPARAPHE